MIKRISLLVERSFVSFEASYCGIQFLLNKVLCRFFWQRKVPAAKASLQKTVERYQKNTKEVQIDMPHTEEYMEQAKQEMANMVKKIELLEVSQRRLLGQELGSCSIEELQEIDGQLEQSLQSIRARKAQLFNERIEQLKAKSGAKSSTKQTEAIRNFIPSCQTSEVETELFIGLPEKRFR
ncbi:hypothetical protein Q3G72_032672 [Acer saccharum]|nr:hypothetical protein Q3G72_032672 [Acer saccharum]